MTERQRLISRVAAAMRLNACSFEFESASRFIAEWLDGHKIEGEIADRLKIDSGGRWKKLVEDVLVAVRIPL
jgi:hypothetical protein